MVMAALAEGTTVLNNASDAGDSVIMSNLLKQLGIKIEKRGDVIVLIGNGGRFNEFNGALNAADAGTVMRFLCALCCMIPGETVLTGSDRMHERPIHGLVEALTRLGANIYYLNKAGFPPVKITGGSMKGGKVRMDASMSSQFVSALLMIAPCFSGDTEIDCGSEIASLPYIDMTMAVMKQFGLEIKRKEHGTFNVTGQSKYSPVQFTIEGDASSASYPFAIAALTAGSVEIVNLPSNSLQGDIAFADLLQQMGCSVIKDKTITVRGCSQLKAITADLSGMPDVAQTLAVIASFAKGETVLKGLKTLQHKETKRITALKTEIKKMGIACDATDDTLTIRGGNPHGALIQTYGDHRMAMSFAVAGAKIPGIRIQNPDVVMKSFPGFWRTLETMGIKINLA